MAVCVKGCTVEVYRAAADGQLISVLNSATSMIPTAVVVKKCILAGLTGNYALATKSSYILSVLLFYSKKRKIFKKIFGNSYVVF